jgi:hypothetical protein
MESTEYFTWQHDINNHNYEININSQTQQDTNKYIKTNKQANINFINIT